MEEILNKKNYILLIAIIFVAVSLSGTTYSLFIKVDDTNQFNYKTGILDLEFQEENVIELPEAFPVSDTKGMSYEPYTLSIKNTGSIAYIFDLKVSDNDDNKLINSKYIKVQIDDNLPITLQNSNNTLKKNIILYPGETIKFKIKMWLDINTPNTELGKQFNATLITSGSSFYKTLDESGANHPSLEDNMLPVYYDEYNKVWKKADEGNLDDSYKWYDYDDKMWANSIVLKDGEKVIHDISSKNNNIKNISNINVADKNLILENNKLDINLSNYINKNISIVERLALNDLKHNDIDIISSDGFNLRYNTKNNNFIIDINGFNITSNKYIIEENKFYIISFTMSDKDINLYINGSSILNYSMAINTNYNILTIGGIGNVLVSDLYVYNDILTSKEVNNNYRDNLILITDNLVSGYNNFYPMTTDTYYKSSPLGTTIKDSDINEFYVWIPRFKYRLWNVTGEPNISSYDAYTKGIDISFEKNKESGGSIYCKDNICYSDEERTISLTQNDNDKYYTPSSFTNNEELLGFWVGKYEVSNGCKDNCLTNSSNLTILPNQESWRNNNLSNYYEAIKGKGNSYHIIKNSEWGTISYLSHSKYGICSNMKCTEIASNNTYISGKEGKDSTTGNIYGVYDMAGSASEFVMANYTSNNSLALNNSNFKYNVTIPSTDYDLYSGTNFILGDATKEILLTQSSTGSWDNNYSIFIDKVNNWFIRGGMAGNEVGNGIFYYNATNDSPSEYITTRVVVR
jgi:hypothetical protein